MARIWGMVDVGKRSMLNSQSALQTVGHNIANKNTEGYSRQRVELESNPAVGSGQLRLGTGARVSGVTRTNNSYIEKQIQQEGGRMGMSKGRSEALQRVEHVYNEQVHKGLNKFMADFFNAFRGLSNNPESLAARSLVKETADFLTQDFQRVNRNLTSIQEDIDQQVQAHTVEVNKLTQEIASLNAKVQHIEINGSPANDERDRRDLLIKKLGEKIDVRYSEGTDGMVTVNVAGSGVLVSGHTSRDLVTSASSAREGKREGNLELVYRATDKGTDVVITDQIRGGEIGGLLEVRDETINGLIHKMDSMARTLATEVNAAHRLGVDQYGQKGADFFDMSQADGEYSQFIQLSEGVSTDVGRIVTGVAPNSPGDNRVANVISKLQYKKVFGGKDTVDEFYNSIVGELGVQVSRAQNEFEIQSDLLGQLGKIRESISGVSLDEEATKLIEYQKSFDASARLIRTADEMLDTVLSLKR